MIQNTLLIKQLNFSLQIDIIFNELELKNKNKNKSRIAIKRERHDKTNDDLTIEEYNETINLARNPTF